MSTFFRSFVSEIGSNSQSNIKKMNGLYLWVFPKRYKANKRGEAPLFLRITLHSQRAELALKRFVSPNSWDNQKEIVRGRNPEASSINEQIRVTKRVLYDLQTKLLNEGEIPTAQRLKGAFLGVGKKGKTLIETFLSHNEKMLEQVGKDYAEGTYQRYETCLKLLREYLNSNYNSNDIPLEKLNLEFITGFDHFLRVVRRCNNNTTIKYIKNLRKVINQARAWEWMQHDPFLNYKAKLEPVDREILTQAELDTISAKSFQIERLEFIKNIFLFCCYTGLAYADVKKLSKENLQIGISGRNLIRVNRTKTNAPSLIPVLPMAQDILDKYQNNPECIKNEKLLPVPSNQKYNAYLKEVADLCGIKKNLTSHMARHSFATTVTLNNRVPIETVSKMLGHRSIKTTELYAKVTEVKISTDMAGLMEVYKAPNPLKIVNE